MILSDIKQYLSQRGSASLADISMHFDADPEAMRGMLEQWIRKGRIRKLFANAPCSENCNRCNTKNTEIYQWIDSTDNFFRGIHIKPEHHCY